MPYFGMGEVSFTKNEHNGNLIDTNIRGDLNLTAPLPTSIKMDSTGITAYTTVSTSNFARLDYRGLYIQNGALDIRTGTSDQRGVVLNKNGLKGFKSDGAITFSLDTDGILSLYNGGIDLYTIGTNRYRGVRLDSDGLRGYNTSGTETLNLKASDGSLTLNGGYLKIINGLQRSHLDESMVNKWDSAEQNAKDYADEEDNLIRSDLRLTAALPTTLLLNGNGITAYANADTSKYARMDYRGLYVQNGAIDIRTGTSLTQGVVLNGTGLKAYNSSGTRTFELNSSTGSAYFSGEVFVGSSSAYTQIIENYLKVYGSYYRTWGSTSGTQRVTVEIKDGKISMKNEGKGTLYYSDYGISTWDDGTGTPTSSGVIEFFSRAFNSTTNGLTFYSSGNIGFKSTSSTGGSNIYMDAGTANVIIGTSESAGTWGKIKAKEMYLGGNQYENKVATMGDIDANKTDLSSYVKSSELSSYVTKNSLSSGYTIGVWSIGATNLNSSSGAIKMGSATGNITITGGLSASTVNGKTTSQLSMRESKKNIRLYEGSGLDIVNSGRIRNFQYKEESDIDLPHIGLILDEAPLEVINFDGTGVLTNEALWINWKATQELSVELNNEKAKNELLTEELNDLRADVEYIKSLLQN